jgi:hypothetical protein
MIHTTFSSNLHTCMQINGYQQKMPIPFCSKTWFIELKRGTENGLHTPYWRPTNNPVISYKY